MGQHDAAEFIRILLNDINKYNTSYTEFFSNSISKKEQSSDFNNFFLQKENSFIVNLFYNQIINIFKCKCGQESYSFQKLLNVPILFSYNDNEYNLLALLKYNFSEEIQEWFGKCVNCQEYNAKHSKINKLIMFISLYYYLNSEI